MKTKKLLRVAILILAASGVVNVDGDVIRGSDNGQGWATQDIPRSPQTRSGSSRPSGPTQEEIAQKQRETDASDLNEKGRTAYANGDYEGAVKFFQAALDKTPDDSVIQQNLKNTKDQIAAQIADKKRRENEAFNKSKSEALSQLKGVSTADSFDSKSGLKGVGSLDTGLKDSLHSGDKPVLKTLSASSPVIITDSRVVDARNVPSGLPKFVEDSIPHTPAGDRVRKGFQAVTAHDWPVALAWFQDALNHEPGDPGLERLVDLARYTLQRRSQTQAAVNAADEKAAKAFAHNSKMLDSGMSEELNNGLFDFFLNYVPQHPETYPEFVKASAAPTDKPSNPDEDKEWYKAMKEHYSAPVNTPAVSPYDPAKQNSSPAAKPADKDKPRTWKEFFESLRWKVQSVPATVRG